MKLIAILVCLGVERYFRLGLHLHRFSWLSSYVSLLQKIIKPPFLWKSWAAVALLELPILILVALLCYLTADHLYGFIGLLFAIVVLLYCLGPEDIYQEVQDYLAASTSEDQELQNQYLTEIVAPVPPQLLLTQTRTLNAAILVKGNNQLLGVLFWFLMLGPIGAVLYRLTDMLTRLSFTEEKLVEATSQFNTLWQLLNWIPARLTALIYTLMGNFTHSFNIWLQYAKKGLSSNEQLLQEVGIAAINGDLNDGQQALALLDRALIMVVVLTGIFTLGAWIY